MIFYQTPAMRATQGTKDFFLPGTLVPSPLGGNAVGIQKPDGSYVSVLHNDPFTDHSQSAGVLDQETFYPDANNPSFLIADRSSYPEGQAFVVVVIQK